MIYLKMMAIFFWHCLTGCTGSVGAKSVRYLSSDDAGYMLTWPGQRLGERKRKKTPDWHLSGPPLLVPSNRDNVLINSRDMEDSLCLFPGCLLPLQYSEEKKKLNGISRREKRAVAWKADVPCRQHSQEGGKCDSCGIFFFYSSCVFDCSLKIEWSVLFILPMRKWEPVDAFLRVSNWKRLGPEKKTWPPDAVKNRERPKHKNWHIKSNGVGYIGSNGKNNRLWWRKSNVVASSYGPTGSRAPINGSPHTAEKQSMGSTIYADWVFTSPVLSTAEYPNIIAQLTTFVERHVFFFFPSSLPVVSLSDRWPQHLPARSRPPRCNSRSTKTFVWLIECIFIYSSPYIHPLYCSILIINRYLYFLYFVYTNTVFARYSVGNLNVTFALLSNALDIQINK